MAEICVIIPMFGFNEMTKACVELVKQNAGIDVDILVVDDCSEVPYEDGSINVIRTEVNSGYTGATNEGMLWCSDRYKYLMLLNNDIVPEPNFIKPLYDHLETTVATGIASSLAFMLNGKKRDYYLYGLDLIRGHQVVIPEPIEEVVFCYWLSIYSCLVRMEMVRYIGILDPQFINYCSDSEYCLRANVNNWNVAIVPGSIVQHLHQITTTAVNAMGDGDRKVSHDQSRFIAKLAGLKYHKIMEKVPLDCETETWGRITFDKYNKEEVA